MKKFIILSKPVDIKPFLLILENMEIIYSKVYQTKSLIRLNQLIHRAIFGMMLFLKKLKNFHLR